MLNKLGNQALLNNRKNRGAKDTSFLSKKDFYKNQALDLIKGLLKYMKWGETQIRARQKEMANKALATVRSVFDESHYIGAE